MVPASRHRIDVVRKGTDRVVECCPCRVRPGEEAGTPRRRRFGRAAVEKSLGSREAEEVQDDQGPVDGDVEEHADPEAPVAAPQVPHDHAEDAL